MTRSAWPPLVLVAMAATVVGSACTAGRPTGPAAGRPTSAPAATSRAPEATASATLSRGAGRLAVTVHPDAPALQRLTVRPRAVVSLVLRPRPGLRWTSLTSDAPSHAIVSRWRIDADGSAHAEISATRGGSAVISARARSMDSTDVESDPPRWRLRLAVAPVPIQG